MRKILSVVLALTLILSCTAIQTFAEKYHLPDIDFDVRYDDKNSFMIELGVFPNAYTENANVMAAVYKNNFFQELLICEKIQTGKFFHSENELYKITDINENGDNYTFKCFVFEENLKPILPVQTYEFCIKPDFETETPDDSLFVLITEEPTSEINPYAGRTPMYKFEGYDARNNADISGWISPSSDAVFSNVNKGDAVRLGTDDEGYYTLDEKDVLFGANINRADVELSGNTVGENGVYEEVIVGDGTDVCPQYRTIWGSVQERDANILNISKTIIDDTTTEEEASANIYSINRDNLNSARIYIYNTERDLEMTLVERSDNAATVEMLNTFIAGTKSSEVFVFLVSNEVRLMIIIEE